MLFPRPSKSKSKRTRKLRFDSLESREVPAIVAGDAIPPAMEKVRVDTPPTLSSPEMPALANMSAGMVGAIRNMWKLPFGSQTNEWVIQLPEGQLPFALSTIGAVSVQDVPFWSNSYVVNFSTPVDVGSFPAVLGGVTEAEFYYPLISRMLDKKFVPNDTLFTGQWHLRNTGQNGGTSGADANLVPAWDVLDGGGQPVRGAGVVIGIVDDGLQIAHPDLAPNYSSAFSRDFNDNDGDPSPNIGQNHGHGTSVAGVAAGRGNNNLGVSGSAPEATLAGLRLLGDNFSDADEAAALGYQAANIDIYSNSWGPADNGTLGFIGPMALARLETGTTSGRGGLGSIYTWAAGNGLGSNDNVNYDSYANSRYVIAVGAIDHSGVQSFYSEPGASMLVTAYSEGSVSGITTTDLVGSDGDNGLPDQNYTNSFGGTSSATPLVSGVIALMLDVNPALTYRDVQHILAKSAEKNNPGDSGWTNNGAGLHVNHKYGFGAIDALAAVNMAKTWTNVPAAIEFGSPVINVNTPIPDNNATGVTRTFNMTQDMKLEHVEMVFNTTGHTWRGDLRVVLTSPSGTQSVLAEQHLGDDGDDYSNWVFSTVRHWDESPLGTWTIQVSDGFTADFGNWENFSLNFIGTPAANPPSLGSIESSTLDYVTGQGQVQISQSLTVVDTDSVNVGGATVRITTNYNNTQDFLRFTNQNGISGNFSVATGILTLSGTATVAQYQAALRSVAYENTSAAPTISVRRVEFRATDVGGANSNILFRNINIIPVNSQPTLNLIGNPPTINEDGSQTVNLTGITAGGDSQDLFVTATSDNPGLISTINVNYTSPATTGSLNYSPVADQFGTAIITVKVKDSGGTFNFGVDEITRTFTVNVNSVNDAPRYTKGPDFNVILDAPTQTFPNWATDINRGAANESGQTLTFVVTNGDNALFSSQPAIDDSGTLTFTPMLGASGFTTVNVRLEDNGGTAFGGQFQSGTQSFTINIEANDAPVLDNSVTRRFTAIPRGTTDPLGDTIASLVGPTITDPDPLPFEGIAVTNLTETANGTWQYSLDAGANWLPFGTVSTTAARLLRSTDMARFIPSSATFVGTPKMSYHAWDQTSGVAGDPVNLEPLASTTGLDRAFSLASTTAGLRVAMTMTPLLEDPKKNKGDQVFAMTGALVTDLDLKAKRGIAVTGLASTTLGTWEYTSGGKFVPIGSVSPSNALLLTDKDRIRFVPNTNQSGEAKFFFHAWDQTNGIRGSRKDISAPNDVGGGTAFSAVEDTMFIQVLPANDQPVLALGGLANLTPVPIGTAEPTGNTVAQILGGFVTDGDATDPRGMGIVGLTNVSGTWQYRLNGSGTWTDIPAASIKSAFLLGELDSVRFRPASAFSGSSTFKFKAWDQSSGTIGAMLDPTKNLSFSVGTQTARVLISNEPRLENSAPQLNTLSAPDLTPGVEDKNGAGDPVSAILLGGTYVVDPDFDDLQGIVVKGATSTAAGTWQFNAGAGWKSMTDASPSSAILLRDTDKVRFLPAKNANGQATLTFHAWDRTQGSGGQRADLTRPGAIGGTSAFSFLFDTCTINITPVNDVPVLNVERLFLLSPIAISDPDPVGDLVGSLLGSAVSDVDVGDPKGIAITKFDQTQGAWQYQLNGTSTWVTISGVSNNTATLVRDIDRLRFFPVSGIEAKQFLSFKAWDQSTGTVGASVDTAVGTSFSKATGTMLATVNAVNDRPILYPKVAARLDPVLTNDSNSPGTLVGNLMAYSAIDPDASALKGMAVVMTDIKKGTWQFSTDAGTNWQAVDAVSTKLALLLRAQDLIRFVPVGGFVGTAKLTYHAWDQTTGTEGTKVNPLAPGATAFSTAKATSIVKVNTAPNIDA